MSNPLILPQTKARACREFGITPAELTSRSRKQPYVNARVWCWKRLRNAGWTWGMIGRAFERDHTTICQMVLGRTKADRARANG